MSFFRRKIDPHTLGVRLAGPGDRLALGRMVHSASRRFLTASVEDMSDVFASDPTAVLTQRDRLLAALTFGWRSAPVAWIRTVLIASEIAPDHALRMLSDPLYEVVRGEGVTTVAITLDEWSEPWLRRPLLQNGYEPMVEVVGYEKTRLDRPAGGNQEVHVRRAQPADLDAVLALDRACFPLPWVKSAEIFGPALAQSPCFLLAEWEGAPVGYAFVTGHHGGRLFHLVRIAVLPASQRNGIGVRLLAEIVDWCARRQADVLTLNTQADNYPAQRLYERFGFVRTGEHQTVLGRNL
jgi:[ribosomal protein S18]-alanine N-acetyltransferase